MSKNNRLSLHSYLKRYWGLSVNGDRSTLYLKRYGIDELLENGVIQTDKEHNCKTLVLFNEFCFYICEYKTEEEAKQGGDTYRKKDNFYYSIPSDTLILRIAE